MTKSSSPDPDSSPLRLGAGARIRAWFLTGVIVSAPIGLTMYLTYVFVSWVDRNVALLIPEALVERLQYVPFGVPGFGLVVAIFGLTLIGFLTANFLGRALLKFGERVVNRMPVVRSIYSALKQIFETVFASSSNSFRQVVLIQYPRHGSWTIGFMANEARGELERRLPSPSIGVYVPTTPNPTSGFLLFVPRDEAIFLDMSVEEAMKYVISVGTAVPPDRLAP